MKKKGLLSIALAAVTLFGACGGGNGDTSSAQPPMEVYADDVEVWSAPATEKVMKDKLDLYENIKGAAEINVLSAKGEYEGEHLILTSEEKDVTGINLQSFDLTLDGDDTVKFPKENIEIFFEKYLDVKKIYDANGAPTGKYPDALIPMQAIVDCKENEMDGGTNQGLYVRFNVPVNQPAGTYKGNLQLSYAKHSKSIPVTLEVADLTVSQETHSRTHFISEWQYRLGELDSTQAMLDKYVEAGLDYRISPAGVVIEDSYDEEGIAYYVEKAAAWMRDPRCSHVSIPLQHTTQTRVIDGKSITANAVNAEGMEKVLDAFIAKSFEDNFDYIVKLGTHLVDEPQLNKALDRTKLTTTIYKETLEKVASELEQESTDNPTLQATLVESVRNIRAVITASYDEDYVGYIDTWCPTVDYYDTESQRANYAEQEEKWWYTCISPRAPFPTYHIEDTLLSARTMSWMQAEYDVVGNLFWATNVYANYDGSKYVNIEDFFEGDASRFSQVNGDGFLFYPGKQYGVDGPIGSLRLEAIRDGLEEYEILYELKNNYQAVSQATGMAFDAKNAIRNLTIDLYSGTRVATNSEKFDAARKALFGLARMSNSDGKLSVIEYADDGYGTITYKVFAADGYQLYNGNSLLTASETVTGGKIYTINNTLANDVNAIKLRLVKGDEEYVFEKNLGGKVVCHTADKFATAFSEENTTVTATLVDASTVASGESGQFVKLEAAGTLKPSQRFSMNSDIIKAVNANTKKVVFRIYCEGLPAEGLYFDFSVDMSKNSKYVEVARATLHNGMNVVTANTAAINFVRNGDILKGLFTVGDSTNKSSKKTIYLKDVTVYNK